MLAPGTRFAHTKTWTFDGSDNGEKYYDIYHVVSAAPKSLLLLRATLFHGDIDVEGNELMDKVVQAQTSDKDTRLPPDSNTPRRYMLNKVFKGHVYFNVGKGTAMDRVQLKGGNPVQFLKTSPTTVVKAALKKDPHYGMYDEDHAALKKKRVK